MEGRRGPDGHLAGLRFIRTAGLEARGPQNALSLRPIFDLESLDALEFGQIAGDERQATRSCLSGDQDVLGADRRALSHERGSDLARRPGIFPIEFENDDVCKEQAQRLEVELDFLATIRAKIKLVCNDGGGGQRSQAISRKLYRAWAGSGCRAAAGRRP